MAKLANAADLKSAEETLTGSSPVEATMIAWAAGLFEGEGSMFLVKQIRNEKEYKYTRMELRMTDQDVVEKFRDVLGVGRIHYKNSPSLKPNWKDSWCWQLTNKEECRQVIDKFWPYLGKRRRDKVLELDL